MRTRAAVAAVAMWALAACGGEPTEAQGTEADAAQAQPDAAPKPQPTATGTGQPKPVPTPDAMTPTPAQEAGADAGTDARPEAAAEAAAPEAAVVPDAGTTIDSGAQPDAAPAKDAAPATDARTEAAAPPITECTAVDPTGKTVSCSEYGWGTAYCNPSGKCVACPVYGYDCDKDPRNDCEHAPDDKNCEYCGQACLSLQHCEAIGGSTNHHCVAN